MCVFHLPEYQSEGQRENALDKSLRKSLVVIPQAGRNDHCMHGTASKSDEDEERRQSSKSSRRRTGLPSSYCLSSVFRGEAQKTRVAKHAAGLSNALSLSLAVCQQIPCVRAYTVSTRS